MPALLYINQTLTREDFLTHSRLFIHKRAHRPPAHCTTATPMHPSAPPVSSDSYRILAERMVGYAGPYEEYQYSNYSMALGRNFGASSSSGAMNYFPVEDGVTAELHLGHGRDLAASRNQHKEAEKQRRMRINSHLDKLRSLLPCNFKTDKATLLAKVVQHVKELKQQASETIPDQLDLLPSESDEFAVLSFDASPGGPAILKASFCCEDRSDLLPELIETLKSLHLRTIRAKMATVGGRVRSVLFLVSGHDDDEGRCPVGEPVGFLRDALKTIVEKQGSGGKRRRFMARSRVEE